MKTTAQSASLLSAAVMLSCSALGINSSQATEPSDLRSVAKQSEKNEAERTALPGSTSLLGILPADREGVQLGRSERNPFIGTTPSPRTPDNNGNEKDRIRSILSKVKIGGITESKSGVKVLFGDRILELGTEVSHVIEKQTQRLLVVEITRERIEFAWLKQSPNSMGSRFALPIDLKPQQPTPPLLESQ